MTRMAMLVLAALLGLAGCAHMSGRDAASEPSPGGFDVKLNAAPLPRAPLVHVVKGYLVVDQEPIRLWSDDYRKDGDGVVRTTIKWQLPRGNYTWPEDGSAITFKPQPRITPVCLVNRAVLVCSLVYEPKAQYKYTLTALDNSKPLLPLDPYIFNME